MRILKKRSKIVGSITVVLSIAHAGGAKCHSVMLSDDANSEETTCS